MGLQDAVDQLHNGQAEPVQEADVVEEPEVDGPEPFAESDDDRIAPGSVLAQLRARARQLAERQTVDLPIPGYDDIGLVGRYTAISLARTLERSNTFNPVMPEWQVAADSLSRALVQLVIRDPETGELEPFAPGVALRFDDDLVDALGLQPAARTAREVLKALCGGGELGESRISAHFMAYQGWLMGGADTGETPVQEVIDQTLGESRGT
jgi:hypothetical protein